MQTYLTAENIERILELLRKNCESNKDKYLINYLETIKNQAVLVGTYDEIPF
jgi:hypothetical protein